MRRFLSTGRLLGFTLSLALVSLAACGGGDDEPAAEQTAPPAAARPGGPVPEPPASDAKFNTPAITKRQLAEKRKRERKRRRQLVLRYTNASLDLLQLQASKIATKDGARSVAISLAPEAACKAERGDDERLSVALKHALTFVKTADVTVGGKTPLSRHLADGCGPGSGPVVLQQNGVGRTRTTPFTINGRKWTIDFEAQKGFFFIRVLSGNELVRQIGVEPGTPNRRTLSGPGTFRLQIRTNREWSVTVRDGP